MGKIIDALLGLPKYATCDNKGCEQPIAEAHPVPGRGAWTRGSVVQGSDKAEGRVRDRVGTNTDGSINTDGRNCAGTEGGTGQHTPRDGSIW